MGTEETTPIDAAIARANAFNAKTPFGGHEELLQVLNLTRQDMKVSNISRLKLIHARLAQIARYLSEIDAGLEFSIYDVQIQITDAFPEAKHY